MAIRITDVLLPPNGIGSLSGLRIHSTHGYVDLVSRAQVIAALGSHRNNTSDRRDDVLTRYRQKHTLPSVLSCQSRRDDMLVESHAWIKRVVK